MNVQPRPGFDWSRVTWGRPDSVVSAVCSYCSASISEGDMPLRLWQADGHAAQFCDRCQRRWFGLQTFAPDGFDDRDGESDP
jgi:hypothetical protein